MWHPALLILLLAQLHAQAVGAELAESPAPRSGEVWSALTPRLMSSWAVSLGFLQSQRNPADIWAVQKSSGTSCSLGRGFWGQGTACYPWMTLESAAD